MPAFPPWLGLVSLLLNAAFLSREAWWLLLRKRPGSQVSAPIPPAVVAHFQAQAELWRASTPPTTSQTERVVPIIVGTNHLEADCRGRATFNVVSRCADRVDGARLCNGTLLACSLMPQSRSQFQSAWNATPTLRRALHRIPGGAFGSAQQLLVPILKPLGAAAARRQAAAEGSAVALRPWPERAKQAHTPWPWLPAGDQYSGATSCASWYCEHFTAAHERNWLALYDRCYAPSGVFGRDDVRLVLDVGGSTGGFARSVRARHGDRVVTITANFWVHAEGVGRRRREAHHHNGTAAASRGAQGNAPLELAPFHQYLGAHGYPSVAFDMYSYFPFGEGALDVVHSSWAYHDGVPRTTLFEVARVLRPGGFFVLRQMKELTLRRVHAYAKLLGWRLVHAVRGCNLGDVLVMYQVPEVRYVGPGSDAKDASRVSGR